MMIDELQADDCDENEDENDDGDDEDYDIVPRSAGLSRVT